MGSTENYKKNEFFKVEDLRQSKSWREYCTTKGWRVVDIPSQKRGLFIQAIVLPLAFFGLSFLKLQRSKEEPDWQEFAKIRRKNRVISSIIEPLPGTNTRSYKRWGYKLSKFPYLATKTIVVDLTKSEKELWKNLSENTRRLIQKNKEIKVKKVKPLVFLKIWKKYSKIWTLTEKEIVSLKEKLGKKVTFYLCYKQGKCQSGILLLRTRDMANYYHSFTTSGGRRTGAHFALVWKTFLEAKNEGLKHYDFEGIYDIRWPQKKWIGFTEFKKKFGGKEISFPGCFHRWF